MASTQAVTSTALACTFWVDRTNSDPHIRVYYQSSNFAVHEVKWDKGAWKSGSSPVFNLNSRAPLAAIAYPGDGQTTPGPNPEIHIYFVDNTSSPPKIKDWKKSENSEVWSYVGEVPAYNLTAVSNLGAAEYSDPYIRVYYQDTDGYIRESKWNSWDKKWVVSTGGSDSNISQNPARLGTPIGADVENGHYYPRVTVAWQDANSNIAAASVNSDTSTLFTFPKTYPASPSGSLTVAMWNQNKVHIYYDGDNDGIQKLEYNGSAWSGPVNSFTGDITDPNAD
ncbi:hypothetical protein SISSUDRAFT_1067354, partial [Sistotremastrum suecicum HHB10207 ss-3]